MQRGTTPALLHGFPFWSAQIPSRGLRVKSSAHLTADWTKRQQKMLTMFTIQLEEAFHKHVKLYMTSIQKPWILRTSTSGGGGDGDGGRRRQEKPLLSCQREQPAPKGRIPWQWAIRTGSTKEIVPLLTALKPKSPDKIEGVWGLAWKTAKSIANNELLFTQLVAKC